MKCECPIYCRYCGRRRSRDHVGLYCKTKNCQWSHGYRTCRVTGSPDKPVLVPTPRRRKKRKKKALKATPVDAHPRGMKFFDAVKLESQRRTANISYFHSGVHGFIRMSTGYRSNRPTGKCRDLPTAGAAARKRIAKRRARKGYR